MKKILINLIVPALITLLLLVTIEGVLTWAKAIKHSVTHNDELKHTTYNPDLGWQNIPNIHLPDLYGPGKYVHINDQGFRNNYTIREKKSTRITRIVCSGDSFTFGQGVANDKTWCNLISTDPLIESVNLGIPGYGTDQSYLRYIKDASNLEHNIHIFAFIGADLERMTRNAQHDFGKPILKLENNKIVTENTPVPKISMTIKRTLKLIGTELNTIKAVNRFLKPGIQINTQEKIDDLYPILTKVSQEMIQISKDRNIRLYFVYLPTKGDLTRNNPWRELATELTNKLGLKFIDLTPPIRKVPNIQVEDFFIPKHLPGDGHYSELGNQWVADQIDRHIKKL